MAHYTGQNFSCNSLTKDELIPAPVGESGLHSIMAHQNAGKIQGYQELALRDGMQNSGILKSS